MIRAHSSECNPLSSPPAGAYIATIVILRCMCVRSFCCLFRLNYIFCSFPIFFRFGSSWPSSNNNNDHEIYNIFRRRRRRDTAKPRPQTNTTHPRAIGINVPCESERSSGSPYTLHPPPHPSLNIDPHTPSGFCGSRVVSHRGIYSIGTRRQFYIFKGAQPFPSLSRRDFCDGIRRTGGMNNCGEKKRRRA